MTVLKINELEKHVKDTVLFPKFSLTVSKGEVTAIYSSLNVRSILLQMLSGEIPVTNDGISVNGIVAFHNKAVYFTQIGILFLDDGIYERLTVKEHFTFFKRLYSSTQTVNEVLRITQLEERGNKKVKALTPSEKRRVQFARLLFQNPALFVFEEPNLNVDIETNRVFIKMVERIQQKGKSILVLTGNMESAIMITNRVYRLDEDGLQGVNIEPEELGEEETVISKVDLVEEKVIQPIRFDKIPTKVNDKMVLFDPPEIDYIESNAGQSHIHIKGEAFSGVFTLTELEERLHPYGFFRCHRSYIVNLQRVREIITWTRNSYSLVLDDKEGSKIPLSKTKMAELKEMLGIK